MPEQITLQPDKIDALIRDCAARLIMPRFNMLKEGDIESKSGPGDLVTIADRETEAELERTLPMLDPGSVVIGEEGIAAGRTSTDILRDAGRTVWIVDPVDGTWNFVHGQPKFAVMLARVAGGETTHGWIYDVPANRMLHTERGGGAWLEGVRQHVAPPCPLIEASGFCGARYFAPEHRPKIKAFATRVKALHTFGCAGHEYLNVVAGHYDFALYSRGKPWDHLAGTLAVSEAGGVVKRFDGSLYRPQDNNASIVAASGQALLAALQVDLLQTLRA